MPGNHFRLAKELFQQRFLPFLVDVFLPPSCETDTRHTDRYKSRVLTQQLAAQLLPVSAGRFDCTDEYTRMWCSAAAAEKGRVSFCLSLALLASTGRLDELQSDWSLRGNAADQTDVKITRQSSFLLAFYFPRKNCSRRNADLTIFANIYISDLRRLD